MSRIETQYLNGYFCDGCLISEDGLIYGWKNFNGIVKPVIEKYVIGSDTDVIT